MAIGNLQLPQLDWSERMPEEQQNGRVVLEACAVNYRLRDGQVEFNLLLIEGDSRWEFPHGPILASEDAAAAAVRVARESAGLECRLANSEPLGEFRYTRDGQQHYVTALLVEVVGDDPQWMRMQPRRRRTFNSEEARVRLRRKPMRLFAAVARRLIETAAKSPNRAAG